MKEGLVTIHALGGENATDDTFLDVIVQGMADLLAESVSSTAQTLPMFDDSAGGLLRAMVEERKVSDPHRSRAAEAGLAGRLIGSLEAFPDAEMSVVSTSGGSFRRRLSGSAPP